MQSTYTVLLLFGKSATPIQKLDTSAGSESAATIKRLGQIVGQLRQMWAMIADQKQHCMSKILLATAFVWKSVGNCVWLLLVLLVLLY